ncbi:Alcohol dehydrogenase [Roseomonas mucosa]|uniref:Alcohol dehydrogenase n=1 Tax=Roseomonas mucosa TaxID=207340 RepID=A0A379N2C1_9PROT|nr:MULTISPECIES: NAD(P)-dependent alcohol dehydrogenase [Roseomonas]MBS5902212.1 NAD(P)-dependent alcohol dehydrogenase [Acetobacteraceae bacterium]MCG7351515.1 NAD(P)-dependent alcohol dehydrogenase [Roseomonas mucosa]MCG7356273.1 NAD(P)-dependent alcohol dehydrogenase [Roseomonas mucosa]MDT8289458.1 NAD(P)-dependent alcohol dehydrogenase [Roseomonas mucosa]MDT8293324.1 NAD(P)-dependent alcohol dehydrogenase [Roseomonas mucosa]
MRAYHLPKAGAIEDLTLTALETPRPARRQVLVRMRAASLNYRDLLVATGRYGKAEVRPGLVPLSDGAGEVAAVGPDVTRVKEGDRVAGIFMQGWIAGPPDESYRATALGGSIDGVLAEYVLFEEEGLVHLPEHLSFEEGACLPCAGVTAWNALTALRPVGPEQTVLLLGTGGVSIFALQLAHAAGARVIVTSSSDEKLARAKELGAAEGVNYRTHPDWEKEVWALTGKRGVDHVVEVGGAGTLPKSIAASRVGGAVHLIGVLTGGQIDPLPVMQKAIDLRGVFVGSREMFEAMNRAVAFHRIQPVIDRVFPFEEAQAAYRHLESQAHLGKVVIRFA